MSTLEYNLLDNSQRAETSFAPVLFSVEVLYLFTCRISEKQYHQDTGFLIVINFKGRMPTPTRIISKSEKLSPVKERLMDGSIHIFGLYLTEA